MYSARLRHLASSCNFGKFLNRSLRHRFVCGIRNPATRKNLFFLSEDRTFQQAMQVAIADEIAAKEFLQVQQQLSQPVHAVTRDPSPLISSPRNSSIPTPLPPAARQGSPPKSPRQSTAYTCFSCGNSDHIRSSCKFLNAVCHNNGSGHIARVCKSGVNAMCVEEEFPKEQVPEEEELLLWCMMLLLTRDLKFLCH